MLPKSDCDKKKLQYFKASYFMKIYYRYLWKKKKKIAKKELLLQTRMHHLERNAFSHMA